MSNITQLTSRAQIKQEACEWLIRIDSGELSPEETEAFRQWAASGQVHLDCLVELAQKWDSMSVLEELAEIFPYVSMPPNHDKSVGNSFKFSSMIRLWMLRLREQSRLLWCGTGVAAASLLVVWVLIAPDVPQQEVFVTPIGAQATHRLEDGSEVKLNTNSHLVVEYSDSLRLLTLVRGEANFDVESDSRRPFVVRAGSGVLQAIGTIFNVRYVADKVDVTVIEGMVKVASQSRESKRPLAHADSTGDQYVTAIDEAIPVSTNYLQLSAGQSATYDQDVNTVTENVSPDLMSRKLAWHDGVLLFQGETLREALAQISQYTEKELIIADESISELRIGGHYDVADIDALLLTISQALDLRTEHVSANRIQFYSNRTGIVFE